MNRLLFVLVLTSLSSAVVKSESENCQECTKHFDEALRKEETLKKMVPLTVPIAGFCDKCQISGLNTIKRVKGTRVCVTKTPSGDVERQVVVEITNLTYTCYCDLAKIHNPILVMQTSLALSENPCIIKQLNKVFSILIDNFKPSSILDTIEYVLGLVKVFLNSVGASGQFTINNVWYSLKLGFNLVTNEDGGNALIENLQFISAEPNNFKEFCEGPDVLVDFCSKLHNNKFIIKILMETEKFYKPCTIEKLAENILSYKHVFTELACKV